jgi:RNA polymerase sigma-70 factor (ECF subfamily)
MESAELQKIRLTSVEGNDKHISFNLVFEQCRPVLYNIALRLLGYGEDAKDAVQETYIRALTNLHTLKDDLAIAGWLKTIVRNQCLMELRARKKKAVAETSYSYFQSNAIADAYQNLDRSEHVIKGSMFSLSETLQLPAMLRFYSRANSYDEIATILDIPIGTVRSRLSEVRTRLSVALKKDETVALNNTKAREMEDFFQYHFDMIYEAPEARASFFDQIDKDLLINFTSGKSGRGRHHIEKEIDFDLENGVRTCLKDSHSTGTISVLEINIQNPEDKPDLCPLAATFIMVHPKSKTEKMYLHNSPRYVHLAQ